MKKLFFIWLLCFSMGCIAAPAATVLYTMNEVTVQHNGQSQPLTRGSTIDVGDTIITGADAHAQIKYTNGTLVTLLPNSNYKTLNYSASNNNQSLNANLDKGALHYKSEGKKRATIGNPVAALAVVGTEFLIDLTVNTQDNGVKVKPALHVDVLSGQVRVSNQIYGPGASPNFNNAGRPISGTFNNKNDKTVLKVLHNMATLQEKADKLKSRGGVPSAMARKISQAHQAVHQAYKNAAPGAHAGSSPSMHKVVTQTQGGRTTTSILGHSGKPLFSLSKNTNGTYTVKSLVTNKVMNTNMPAKAATGFLTQVSTRSSNTSLHTGSTVSSPSSGSSKASTSSSTSSTSSSSSSHRSSSTSSSVNTTGSTSGSSSSSNANAATTTQTATATTLSCCSSFPGGTAKCAPC